MKGKKAYNNGIKVIYLFEGDTIPDGFVKGGLSTRTPEQIALIAEKSRQTQQQRWKDKSDVDKNAWRESCRQSQLNRSQQAKEQTKQKIQQSYLSKTPEEKQSTNTKKSVALKETWKNVSEQDRKVLAAKIVENGGGWNKDTICNTIKQKYNCDNISQLQNVKEKSKQSIMQHNFDKYGFYWNCQLPQCKNSIGSKGCHTGPNESFANLLDENSFKYEREFSIANHIYDFKVGNTLIEINPFATHNSSWSIFNNGKGLDRNYHFNKSNVAHTNGYRCIHVFDWDDKNKIINQLKNRPTVYARECTIQAVSYADAIRYINEYHLQGYARCSIRLGLYHENELVAIMTFGKPRYNKLYTYELIRFCAHYNVVGGAEKLFKYFVDTYNPVSIVSYCDYSKFNGNMYSQLGFEKITQHISKHWYNPKTQQHILDTLLLKLGYDKLFSTSYGKGTSNAELMLQNGFVEIYDAGQITFVWLNNK